MELSKKVAEECNQDYLLVHYDLAIAKPALTIQAQESPRFDNLFICFGAFHIQMAYFRAIGHIIGESGRPAILANTDVLSYRKMSAKLKKMNVLLMRSRTDSVDFSIPPYDFH